MKQLIIQQLISQHLDEAHMNNHNMKESDDNGSIDKLGFKNHPPLVYTINYFFLWNSCQFCTFATSWLIQNAK